MVAAVLINCFRIIQQMPMLQDRKNVSNRMQIERHLGQKNEKIKCKQMQILDEYANYMEIFYGAKCQNILHVLGLHWTLNKI